MATVLLIFILRFTLAIEPGILTYKYMRFQEDNVSAGTVINTVVAKSTTHCAAVCSQDDRCQAINVCPLVGSLRQVKCSLLEEVTPQNESSSEVPEDCFQMEKIPLTENETVDTLQCQNGGTLLNGLCLCPMTHGGETCQRLVRDCKEAADHEWDRSDDDDIAVLIQPVGASTPFWILCHRVISYVLISPEGNSFNVNWNTAKNLIGDNSSSLWYAQDYFVGLDNLHHLLSQGEYYSTVYGEYGFDVGQISYGTFFVGPEESSYALSYYSSYSPPLDSLDDGFSSMKPLVFSTPDHDPHNCSRGYPGWFGSDCSGYSFFSNLRTWPANGSPKTIETLLVGVTRITPFSDE